MTLRWVFSLPIPVVSRFSFYFMLDPFFFFNTSETRCLNVIPDLDKPVTKDNFFTETQAQLFSHFSMMEEAGFVDAFRDNVGTGVLGRMQDILQQHNYSVSAISIDEHGSILDGNANFGRPVDVINRWGVDHFYDYVGSPTTAVSSDDMKADFMKLNGDVHSNSGKYGDLWSQAFVDAIDKSTSLRESIENTVLENEGLFTDYTGGRFEMAAKLIKAHSERGVNRDVFFIQYHGYDTHSDQKSLIADRFSEINAALNAFKIEMTALGLMEQVTVVVTSEFARVSVTKNYDIFLGFMLPNFVFDSGIHVFLNRLCRQMLELEQIMHGVVITF